ncbi:hypothetical protein [Streptomyces sp. NPDC051921]|uniref:hypothetical protein n=1 Tax=Streptomyces sp. NPDC051921 TaxID=3155806 RepID=UPI00341F6844
MDGREFEARDLGDALPVVRGVRDEFGARFPAALARVEQVEDSRREGAGPVPAIRGAWPVQLPLCGWPDSGRLP